MNDKQLKLIYEYVGWEVYHPMNGFFPAETKNLDSNSAWECVQEMMKRKGDWEKFDIFTIGRFIIEGNYSNPYFLWLYNPTNFFLCMGAWLEGREVKK